LNESFVAVIPTTMVRYSARAVGIVPMGIGNLFQAATRLFLALPSRSFKFLRF